MACDMVRSHSPMPQRPVPLLLLPASPSFFRFFPVSTFARSLRCLALVLFCIRAVLPGPVWALPASSPSQNTDAVRSVNLPLRQLAGNQLALKGAHGEQRIHLGVRLDEMVVRAHLNLAVTPSPALLPNLSHLQVRLNDKLLSVIPLRADHAGERIERRIELDPRLFVDDNWLSLRLVGHYTLACEDPLHSSLWADVDVDATGFELTIRPLALEDELALFPAPWFDRRSAGRVEVPMVLGLQPSQERLSTASIIASWLGSLAGERGASFPVRRDRLPDRHAIVFASPQQPLPEGLDVPEAQGPTVRLLRHPRLPHVKLLLLQGRNDRELRTAALGLILGRQAISGSSVLVNELGPIPARQPYDAPNWVATDKPVRLGELVPERSALQLQGAQPDAVRVRWRTPPDLWQSPGRSAVLNLRYRVAVASATDNALMSLSLNDSFVRAWRLAASPSSGALGGLGRWLGDADEASGSVRVKLPEFQPRHGNMLEVQLPLGTKPQAGDCAWRAETTRAAVDAESTLDFSALPHFMPMPDLAAFAVSGFPFTRYADLAQTAVVLPPQPDDPEIETLLALMGSFGRWTGAPAWHFEVTTPEKLDHVRDRDLLLLGGPSLHALLKRWQNAPMLALEAHRRDTRGPVASVAGWRSWLRPAPDDAASAPNGPRAPLQIDAPGSLAVISGFESPMQAGRSVVALSSDDSQGLRWLTAALLESAQAAQIQGGLAVVREREVRSFESESRYHTGELPWTAQMSLFVSTHPWLAAGALATALAVLVWAARIRLRLYASRRLKTTRVAATER